MTPVLKVVVDGPFLVFVTGNTTDAFRAPCINRLEFKDGDVIVHSGGQRTIFAAPGGGEGHILNAWKTALSWEIGS